MKFPDHARLSETARRYGLSSLPGNRVSAHSETLGWRSAYADVATQTPYRVDLPAIDDVALAYLLNGNGQVEATVDRRPVRADFRPRQFFLAPEGGATAFTLKQSIEVLHIYIRRSVLELYVEEAFDGCPTAIILPVFGGCDPFLEQGSLGILRAMRDRPPGHAMYVECLAQALAAHLVQHHSTLTRPPRALRPDGLTDHRLRRLADYIEANLDRDLTLGDMAEMSGLSAFYLARTFRAAFGDPPHRYVVRRRIARARELLHATDLPLAEVALACGFAHQSHLSQTFKRAVGVSPGAYRKERSS